MALCNLNIASLNCRGLNDDAKRKYCFNYFKNSSFSIICLQETKLNALEDDKICREWDGNAMLINSACGGGHSGTIILFNSHHIKVLESICDSEGRILVADIEIFKDRFHLVNSYFPNDSVGRKSFINSLYPFIASRYPIIWCGDHNMVTDHSLDRMPSAVYKDSHTNDLIKLIETFSFQDACRELYPHNYYYTWYGKDCKSRIDKILLSGQVDIKSYSQKNYYLSDHDLIEVHVCYQVVWAPGRGLWKNKPTIYKNEDFIEKFQKLWDFLKKLKTNGTTTKWWLDAKYRVKNFYVIFQQ